LSKEELQQALCCYITDTLTYIDIVREFCQMFSKWEKSRETDLDMMTDIKDRADKINLNISHVTKSENKGKAFWEYLKSKVTLKADSRHAELEKELNEVLKDTLGGLKKLDCFLDAVEKLAVTSLHVFMENQVLHLPEEISFEYVQVVIGAAQQICPLLLEFKRDANVFFFPKLQNVEVLANQLDRYIQTTKTICEMLDKSQTVFHSCFSDFCLKTTVETVVELSVNLTEDDLRKMLDHISQLEEIRRNQSFRMVFLFQEVSCSDFISQFKEREPRMLEFLHQMEEIAVQLDRMNMGAKFSSVAGSSVGAVGGVLSIVGLASIPFTAGVSLALTMTGVGLGIGSAVNSAVTTVTENGVNAVQKYKAGKTFEGFMEDVQSLQKCLQKVVNQPVSKMEANNVAVALGVCVALGKFGHAVHKGINKLADGTSDLKALKMEGVQSSVGKDGVADVGQAAVKGPVSLSNATTSSFVFSGLFLGMDIFFICKDSISLAKGSETEVSKFIRARAALWSSEMDSWQKIHESLYEGQLTSEKKKIVLETPFYPEM
uniref:Apolipoprotein L n=1 Tax=Amphiprion percula TaxID=161767 RepID=A0A3P8TRN8_AMPPE